MKISKFFSIVCTMIVLAIAFVCFNKFFLAKIRQLPDYEIIKMLNSKNTDELIMGSFQAGESREKKFVPLLLKNADDPSSCTDIRFKGFSVYEEKMGALEKIFKIKSSKKLTSKPDSTIIKFYVNLANDNITKPSCP